MQKNKKMEKKMSDAFKATIVQIAPDVTLFIWKFDVLSGELKDELDNFFVKICEGSSVTLLSTAKKKISKRFDGKTDDWIIGATAEFFIHLFLNYKGYKQECVFKNLEENSIKKGFDGYYSNGKDEWIIESKAGRKKNIGEIKDGVKKPDTINTHGKKILIAYNDIEKKVTGKSDNNPWENAYSHAKVADSSKAILDNLKKLENEYAEEKYQKIEDLNIIPCATLYYENESFDNEDDIKTQIELKKDDFKAKKNIILCASYKSMNILKEYLDA